MKKRMDFKSKFIRAGVVSSILSLMVLALLYFYWNDGPTYGYGNQIAKWISIIKELNVEREPVEEVVPVNVSYDRTTVPYYTPDDEFLGMVDMTDRNKLNSFLKMLKERDEYRYILCDINFSDPQLRSEYDEELFSTIASMRDIVVASSNLETDPEAIRGKTALSEYVRRTVGDDFLKYDFMKDGNPSIALKMWQELDGGTYEESWWGACMNGKLCLKTLIPDFKYVIYGDVYAKDNSMNIQNMGKTLQYYQKAPGYARAYDDKIVLLGSWKNDDIHNTIAGLQPGVVVIYNAYLALKNMDNHVSVWLYILIFIVIWLEMMLIFRNSYMPQLLVILKQRLESVKNDKKNECKIWKRWLCWCEKEYVQFKEFKDEHDKIWEFLSWPLGLINYGTPLAVLVILAYLMDGVFVNVIIVGLFLGIVSKFQEKFKFVS